MSGPGCPSGNGSTIYMRISRRWRARKLHGPKGAVHFKYSREVKKLLDCLEHQAVASDANGNFVVVWSKEPSSLASPPRGGRPTTLALRLGYDPTPKLKTIGDLLFRMLEFGLVGSGESQVLTTYLNQTILLDTQGLDLIDFSPSEPDIKRAIIRARRTTRCYFGLDEVPDDVDASDDAEVEQRRSRLHGGEGEIRSIPTYSTRKLLESKNRQIRSNRTNARVEVQIRYANLVDHAVATSVLIRPSQFPAMRSRPCVSSSGSAKRR